MPPKIPRTSARAPVKPKPKPKEPVRKRSSFGTPVGLRSPAHTRLNEITREYGINRVARDLRRLAATGFYDSQPELKYRILHEGFFAESEIAILYTTTKDDKVKFMCLSKLSEIFGPPPQPRPATTPLQNGSQQIVIQVAPWSAGPGAREDKPLEIEVKPLVNPL